MDAQNNGRRWPRRALVVDDSRMERRVLGDSLAEAGYVVRYAWDLESAKHELDNESFHVVVLDLNLPDGNGETLIAHLAAVGCGAAVVVVSGDRNVGTRVRALRLGAADFMVKPCNSEELVARVDAVVAAAGRRERDGGCDEMATAGRDGVSGVLTRRSWLDRLFGLPLDADGALIATDIVGFRAFNARFGDAAGDEVLTLAAEALLRALPVDASIGRTGGDEFAVLLPGASARAALVLAQRAARLFEQTVAARFGAALRLELATAVVPCPRHEIRETTWREAQLQLAKRLNRSRLYASARRSAASRDDFETLIPKASLNYVLA